MLIRFKNGSVIVLGKEEIREVEVNHEAQTVYPGDDGYDDLPPGPGEKEAKKPPKGRTASYAHTSKTRQRESWTVDVTTRDGRYDSDKTEREAVALLVRIGEAIIADDATIDLMPALRLDEAGNVVVDPLLGSPRT